MAKLTREQQKAMYAKKNKNVKRVLGSLDVERNETLNRLRAVEMEEKDRPMYSEDPGFVEDAEEFIDNFDYKGFDISLYLSSGQNNAYYVWIVQKDGDTLAEIIDSGNLVSDMNDILDEIDAGKLK